MGKIKFSKKMMYSTLAAIGLVGSTGAIVGSVVNNNNLQTNQQISNLNSQIQENNNTINLYDSASTQNTTNQNQTNNSNVDVSNADAYSNEFLKDLSDPNNIGYTNNTDYTTNLSKVRESTNETSSTNDTNYDYNGDLSINSLLQTTKDQNEINLESKFSNQSNLFKTISNEIALYKSNWLSDIQNQIDNLNSIASNNFSIQSIKAIGQYSYVGWYDVGGWDGTTGGKIFYLYNTFDSHHSVEGTDFDDHDFAIYRDPNNALSGYITFGGKVGTGTEARYYFGEYTDHNGDNHDGNNSENPGWSNNIPMNAPNMFGKAIDSNYTNSSYSGITSPSNNLINTDEAKNGFTFKITPMRQAGSDPWEPDGRYPTDSGYVGGSANYANGGDEMANGTYAPGVTGDYWDNNGDHVTHYISMSVKPILNNNMDFKNFGNENSINFGSATTYFDGGTDKNKLSNTNENENITFNTFPDNNDGFYGIWQPIADEIAAHRYYDIYRGLIQWNMTKLPKKMFTIDSNFIPYVNSNNNLISLLNSSNKIDLTKNWGDNDYYYTVANSDYSQTKIVDSNGFVSYINSLEPMQNIIKLYNSDQLQNILQQIQTVKDNIDVTNLNDVKITQNIKPFGSNSPFSATKIVLPSQFDTNYQSFNVSQPNDIYGTNTSYVFNNFLPFLSNQIVIDPQSAQSNYMDPDNSTNGLYTSQPNSIRFKLSENFAQLLSIMNLYNTYKNDVNAINLNSDFLGDGGSSQRDVAIKNFVSLFNNLSFTDSDSNAISQLLSAIKSKDINTIDAILFGNNNNNSDSSKSTYDPNLSNDNTNDVNNRQNVINLIQKTFNDSSTNTLFDNNGNFTFDAIQYLSLLPPLTKEALSNLNITANVSYGDNTTGNTTTKKGTPIWIAPGDTEYASGPYANGGFPDIDLDFDTQNPNDVDTNNNDSQINISNIQFVYKNGSAIQNTQDAYSDNTNFLNNGVNTNLNYMLSEFNNYYPNNNAITVDNNTNSIVYKVHYDPHYGNYTPNSSDLQNQGIPITNTDDTTGLLASQYKTNEQDDIINTAVQNFFTPLDAVTKNYGVVVLNNGANDAGNYKTIVETIANSNNLVLTPDDSSGTFYALVTLDHAEWLFANPYGDSTKTVIDGKMWYVADVANGVTTKIYLVKMNAAKKEVNLSDIQFGAYNGDASKITWGFNDSTNYYYGASLSTNNSYSPILMNGSTPLLNQTITINMNDNNYIKLNDDVSGADPNSQVYKNFGNNINSFFYEYYSMGVKSYSITYSSNTWTINVTLENI